jgi:hypothetical protein
MSARRAGGRPVGVAVAVVLAMLLGGVSAALAQPRVSLTVKPVVGDPKRKHAAPDIEATVVGGPPLPIDKFSLTQVDAKVPVAMKALSLKKYVEGSEAITLIIVLEGHEIWIGNESYVESEEDKFSGVFSKLPPVLEPLSKVGPPGSQAALLVYGAGATVRMPLSPLEQLTADKLGTQKDYAKTINRDLVNGIDKAIGMLKEVTTARKAIVYIGDGADTNPDEAREALAGMRKRAEAAQIELFGIQYVAEGFENEGGQVKTLIPDLVVAQSMEGIASSAEVLAGKINDRYYLTFPGYDPELKAGFTWDGLGHELMLKIDQTELEPITLAMLPKWAPPQKAKPFPWLAVVIPVVGLIVLVALVKIFGGKKASPGAMVEMPAMVGSGPPMMAGGAGMGMAGGGMLEAMPAPKPAGPMKTVMIGAGGDTDGFPVVGWLVPLNGPQQHQTFRLQQGVTKIGTGGTSHIVVDDGFMSTEHFQIAGSPHGFTMIDSGSTNGTYVNDTRVAKQELLDNDVITVGKTNLVFKSIN